VLVTAVALTGTVILAAVMGLLPAYYNYDKTSGQLQTLLLARDVESMLFTGALGYAFF